MKVTKINEWFEKFGRFQLKHRWAFLICLLIFAFDERNSDTQRIFICISRLLTAIEIYDIEYDSETDFIIFKAVGILNIEKLYLLFMSMDIFTNTWKDITIICITKLKEIQ